MFNYSLKSSRNHGSVCHLSKLFVAVPGVLVVVGDEVQIALPDARQGAVGAAQQEGAHVGPGEAAVVGRVGRRHLALEPGEELERLRARVAPVAPVGLVPGSYESKILN